MKWFHWVGAVVILIAGILAGRGSVPRTGTVTVSPPTVARDGGVPEAVAKATVGGGSAATSITCKAEPPPQPRTVYVKVPSGSATVECPEPIACPTLTCSGTATSTGADSHAESAAPVVPPQVVTVSREIRSTWGIGAVGQWSKESGMHPGGGIVFQPWKEVEFSLSATTTPSVQAGAFLRF